MATPQRCRRPVKASLVNWLPWSVLKTSGCAFPSASSSAPVLERARLDSDLGTAQAQEIGGFYGTLLAAAVLAREIGVRQLPQRQWSGSRSLGTEVPVVASLRRGLPRALWLYQPTFLGEREEEDFLFFFCRSKGVRRLFLSSPREMLAAPGRRARLASFLDRAAAEGLAVEALLGEPTWILKENRDSLLARVEGVLAFNGAQPANARFAALHLDVEPHALPGWQERPRELMQQMVAAVAEVRAAIDRSGSNLPLVLDIPDWWDREYTAQLQALVQLADGLVVLVLVAFFFLRLVARRYVYVRGPGLLAGKSVHVESKVAGRIQQVLVEVGERVRAGQAVAELDQSQIQRELSAKRGELATLQATLISEKGRIAAELADQRTRLEVERGSLRRALEATEGKRASLSQESAAHRQRWATLSTELERARRLFTLGGLTRAELLEAQFEVDDEAAEVERLLPLIEASKKERAEIVSAIATIEERLSSLEEDLRNESQLGPLAARVATTQSEITLLEAQLAETILLSPLDGVVSELFKLEKEAVLPGTSLLEIVDDSTLQVVAYLDERHQGWVEAGSRMNVSFESGERGAGVVRRVRPSTEPLPPQFQSQYGVRRMALVVELEPADDSRWPAVVGTPAWVQRFRFPR